MTEKEILKAINYSEKQLPAFTNNEVIVDIEHWETFKKCATVCLEIMGMMEETNYHEEDGQSCGCEAYSDDNPCETFMNGGNQKLREIQQLIKKER